MIFTQLGPLRAVLAGADDDVLWLTLMSPRERALGEPGSDVRPDRALADALTAGEQRQHGVRGTASVEPLGAMHLDAGRLGENHAGRRLPLAGRRALPCAVGSVLVELDSRGVV